MNPLDLPGPEFLVFYLILAGVAVLVAAMLRWILRQPAGDTTMSAPLSSSEIAYLAGGQTVAVHAAVARLVHDKCLSLDAATGELTVRGPLPSAAHPLESAVHAEVAENPARELAKLVGPTSDATNAIRTQLEEQGLLVNAEQAWSVRLWPLLVILMVLELGVVKLCVGMAREKPVGFLIALMVFLGVALIGFAWRPFRSRRGNLLLARLREDNAALMPSVQTRPEGLAGSELSRAFALFGIGALTHESLIGLRDRFAPPTQAVGGGDSSGGGCGGGGGGCGGGGGGGCGGCGGG